MQAIGVIATGGFCTSYFHTNSLHMAILEKKALTGPTVWVGAGKPVKKSFPRTNPYTHFFCT